MGHVVLAQMSEVRRPPRTFCAISGFNRPGFFISPNSYWDYFAKRPFTFFDHNILIIAPTEKYDLFRGLSDHVEYGYSIKGICYGSEY